MTEARIGIVGLGIMGSAIARNLIGAGHAVAGFDTDPDKMARLKSDEVIGCGSAAEAAGGADFLLTSLPTIEALEATVTNLVSSPQRGLIVAELSTMPIEVKQAAHDRLQTAGMILLDCPLSGT